MGASGPVRRLLAIALVGAIASASGLGCGDGGEGRDGAETASEGKPDPGGSAGDDVYDEVPAAALRERPWEVVSKKGETYLANVFYADASQNEQIMPWALDGRTMIDRLVYPTLGNPNLYVKADAEDELVMVLRIEPDAFDHLKPSRAPEGGDSPLKAVTLTEDGDNGFSFLLVARSERAAAESSTTQLPRAGVFRIAPTKVLESPEPADMPAALAKRKTLRFVFDRAAMANVPPGLYDARFEVRKNGALFANVYEYQYNAVRVFDAERDEYTAINVTDTQVAIGAEYKAFTADKLDDFVDAVNAETDAAVKNAAFITFNGDLHNGGSPGSVRQRIVAKTYADEAKRVVGALKRLNFPIFLTAGNHDGYAAVGHVPSLVKTVDEKVGDSLKKVIEEQNNLAWPDYSWDAFAAFLDDTLATPGGRHTDIFEGTFERRAGETFSASFKEVARRDRNVILYDGFYQWQKTYGPLYTSWTFGKNRYVSMNSFELRQHRRTGWGMYTVNYGGAVSKPQLEWLDRELTRGKLAGQDLVVLMHHDPRGGHKGQDLGYYSPMIEFRGIAQSTLNYIFSSALVPAVCKQPNWSLSVDERESCLHDGLQEWMGPDALDKDGPGFFLSGVELLKRFVKSAHARTMVLGHVHFNSLEVLQSGDVLIPNRLSMDPATQSANASIEAANPVRRLAWEDRLVPEAPGAWRFAAPGMPSLANDVETSLAPGSFDRWRSDLDTMLRAATPPSMTTLSAPQGGPRELAILRFTSGADLASQKYEGSSMYGYAALHVTKQTGAARINRMTFFKHDGAAETFRKIDTVDVDRTKSIAARAPSNPVDQLFEW
ncbi:MAG: metallophosphoesterase [Labilithrix sp.]|nr:metallophosphoesterase [Labilithrix sp.]MBX3224365.1 metallophosphoesterase [Labilithrix sp.]